MKKRTVFLILILFSLSIISCKYDFILSEVVPPIDTTKPTTFASIVPILAAKCVACHDNQVPKMTADVAYSQLVPNFVNIASPSSSKLYINATSGTHNNAKVSDSQAALILQWIKEGALDN